MNPIKRFLLPLILAVSLVGCATVGVKPVEPLPVPATLTPAQRTAAMAINEAFVHVAAGYSLVEQLAAGRLAPKAELEGYLEKLDKAFAAANQARKLYESGEILSAQTQAELLNKGLLLILKELNDRKAAK